MTTTHLTAYEPIDPAELPVNDAWEARWNSPAGWGDWFAVPAMTARILAERGESEVVQVRGRLSEASRDARMRQAITPGLAASVAVMAEYVINGGVVSRGELVALAMTGAWGTPAYAEPEPPPIQAQTAQDAASI